MLEVVTLAQRSQNVLQEASKAGHCGASKKDLGGQNSNYEEAVWDRRITSRGRVNILKGGAHSARPREQVLMAHTMIEYVHKKLSDSKLFLSKSAIFIILKHGRPIEISSIFNVKRTKVTLFLTKKNRFKT